MAKKKKRRAAAPPSSPRELKGERAQELHHVVERKPSEPDYHFAAGPLEGQVYARRRIYACPRCKRRRLPYGAQAVVCNGTRHGVAYMRCKACQNHFSLPVG